MAPPPPPCRPRSSSLPALMEELVEEILIRIPPDEPAHLVRAALVCKPWRRIILSDPGGFLRRYRAFHRRHPPLLGFFCNDWWVRGFRLCFNTAADAAFNDSRCRDWCILDCRHGRVLLRDRHGDGENLIVWDPISDAWQELQVPDIDRKCESFHIAVLCAVAGCDHHDCRGGPFLVVYLGAEATPTMDDTIFRALVYTSEARAWGAPVSSSQLDAGCDFDIRRGRAAIIGDKIYCVGTPGAYIVKYDLVKHCISFFSSSSNLGEDPALAQNEDGSLGLASIRDSRLYLWSSSRMVNHGGKLIAEWAQERVIELDKILPIDMSKHYAGVVSGFAEDLGILFISTYVGTFTFELKSGRVRKFTASKDFTAFPFISFFTPAEATGRAATSAEPVLKKLYVDSPSIKGDRSSNSDDHLKTKNGDNSVPE